MDWREKIVYWLKNYEFLNTVGEEDIKKKIALLAKMKISIEDCNMLKGCIDMHVHSTNSDGSFNSHEILFAAYFTGLGAISITDHCITNSQLTRDEYDEFEMLVIPGIEINAEYKGQSTHILAYGQEIYSNKIKKLIISYVEKWNLRLFDMAKSFEEKYHKELPINLLGLHKKNGIIDLSDLCESISLLYPEFGCANDIKLNLFNNKKEDLDSLYIDSKKSYKYLPNALDVIKAFNSVGAITVLAHNKCVENILEDMPIFIHNGLKGIELYHPNLSRTDRNNILKITQENGLKVFGGSDWHGTNKPNSLGFADLNKITKIPFSIFAKGYLGINSIIITEEIELQKLTLEEKIGMLIKPGFDIYSFDMYSVKAMRLFKDTYSKVNKSIINSDNKLIDFIKYNINANTAPFIVNVNQEGGRLNTLEFYRNSLVCGNYTLGKLINKPEFDALVNSMAEEISAFGIRWNLAPVCDLLLNDSNSALGTRSFGNNPRLVSKATKKYVEIMQNKGVATTAKHFPGNGQVLKNGHDNLSVVYDYDIRQLEPFNAAIEGGVASIMISDGIYYDLDPDAPALMSKPIISDLLRNKMDFDGIIMTDNITMPALLEKYTLEDIAIKCINAGVDIIMYDPDFAKSKGIENISERISFFQINRQSIYNAILNAVHNGTITEERIDESVRRIIKFNQKYGLTNENAKFLKFNYDSRNEINSIVAQNTLQSYDEQNILPLSSAKEVSIVIYSYMNKINADSEWKYGVDINKLKTSHSVKFEEIIFNELTNTDACRQIKNDVVIFIAYNLAEGNKQKDLIKQLIIEDKKIIVIGVGTDLEKALMKELGVKTYINICMRTPYALEHAFNHIWN